MNQRSNLKPKSRENRGAVATSRRCWRDPWNWDRILRPYKSISEHLRASPSISGAWPLRPVKESQGNLKTTGSQTSAQRVETAAASVAQMINSLPLPSRNQLPRQWIASDSDVIVPHPGRRHHRNLRSIGRASAEHLPSIGVGRNWPIHDIISWWESTQMKRSRGTMWWISASFRPIITWLNYDGQILETSVQSGREGLLQSLLSSKKIVSATVSFLFFFPSSSSSLYHLGAVDWADNEGMMGAENVYLHIWMISCIGGRRSPV